MYEVDRFEHCGLDVRVIVDEDASSPADWDTFGILHTWHRDYTFGTYRRGELRYMLDERRTAVVARWVALSEGSIVSLPVSVADYGGGNIRLEEASSWDRADGVIFATAETAAMTGVEPADYEEALRQDLAVWSQYAEGDVYGYIVSTPEGDEGDELCSLWGLYGHDYALEEARQAATYEAEALATRRLVEARADDAS